MNYRHAYHAGNFADVLKHAVLCQVLSYLKLKDKPFRVIDTHGGLGCYDLSSTEAVKTGEWRDGIGRVVQHRFSSSVQSFLEPYLSGVLRANDAQTSRSLSLDDGFIYPGSPLFASQLIRRDDKLITNELHPDDQSGLVDVLRPFRNAKVLKLDAWQLLKAQLPPVERRGLIVIDPAFEQPDELEVMSETLKRALKRFPYGIFLVWYPVKDMAAVEAFRSSVTASLDGSWLEARLRIARPFPGLGLTECGLLVLNPPYKLADELGPVLSELASVLAEDDGAGYTLNVHNA